MKSVLQFFALLFCFSPALQSQTLEVINGTIEYEDKKRPAVMLTIDPDTKDVKKAWKKFMQKTYKVDVEGIGFLTNKEVLKIEKSVIPPISNKAMDLYAEIVENGEYTTMSVFGALGYDYLIGPEKMPAEFAAMEDLVFDFLNYFLPDYIKENVNDLEEQVVDLQKNQEDRQKQIEKNKKDIAKMKKEIESMEKENVELQESLVSGKDALQQAETKLRIKRRNLQIIENTINTNSQ